MSDLRAELVEILAALDDGDDHIKGWIARFDAAILAARAALSQPAATHQDGALGHLLSDLERIAECCEQGVSEPYDAKHIRAAIAALHSKEGTAAESGGSGG